MSDALLALGGNVGNSRAILDRAVQLLCDGRQIRLIARSSDYFTPPWGFKYQPPFINLCIAVDTTLSPRDLLARAQEVELKLGRDRAHEKRWGPRTADIDIIAVDGRTVVFVEVRSRSDTSHGHPAETVGYRKQRRIAELATAYIRRHRLQDCPVRIDVVTVTFATAAGGPPVVEHFRNAFDSPI